MLAYKMKKWSLLGSKISVIGNDGYCIPGTIQAVKCDESGKEYFTVKLENDKEINCPGSNLIGNGFKSVSDVSLKKPQKVFITHKDKEVIGYVEKQEANSVFLKLPIFGGQIAKVPLEDVHLIEERPFEQHGDTDKRPTSNFNSSHIKKRIVSESIAVPKSRVRKTSEEPTMDELMAAMVLTNMSSSPVFHSSKSPSIKRDTSPHSFGSSGVGSWNQETHMSPAKEEQEESNLISHKISVIEENKNFMESDVSKNNATNNPASPEDPIETDSDVNDNTTDVPMLVSYANKSEPFTQERQSCTMRNVTPHPIKKEFSDATSPTRPTVLVSPRSQPYPTKTAKLPIVTEEITDTISHSIHQPFSAPVYYVSNAFPSFSEYTNTLRFGQVSTPPPHMRPVDERAYKDSSPFIIKKTSVPIIPNAEETNMQYVGSAPPNIYFPFMASSSPMSSSPLSSYSPATYIRHTPSPLVAVSNANTSTQSQPIPISGFATVIPDQSYPSGSAQPINIPTAKAFSWHSTHIGHSYSPKPTLLQQRQHMHQAASPKMSMPPGNKSLPPGRSKVRGDGKKCRKVYGMENRDMWCTACRWKKACQRFPD